MLFFHVQIRFKILHTLARNATSIPPLLSQANFDVLKIVFGAIGRIFFISICFWFIYSILLMQNGRGLQCL